MTTCTELYYIDTLGGKDLDGLTDKNLPYFVMENLATLRLLRPQCWDDLPVFIHLETRRLVRKR